MELRRVALCVLCLLISSGLAQDCSSGGVCEAGASDGNVTYQVSSKLQGTDALDLCLVVSAASSMADRHRWLQSIVPLLEDELVGMGIGVTIPNRYCLVQFGGRGRYLTGVFLKAENNVFFSASDYVFARRQLQKKGDVADGYEAIQFTLSNAPFRADARVRKSLLLATDMGRSILSTRVNLTRDSLLSLLTGHNVSLNSVVKLSLSVPSGGQRSVLGLHNVEEVSVLSEGGRGYTLVQSPRVQYSSDAGDTVSDYVTLALSVEGSCWPIELLSGSNLSVLTTFVRAFIDKNDIQRTNSVAVCQQCDCVQVGGDGCARRECVEAVDQEECLCLSKRPFHECVSPSPVSPTEHSSLLRPLPTQTPRPLVITGTLDQFPGGEVELNFESTINRASYECILVTSDTDTPTLSPCSSPHFLKSVPAGDHKLLVIGKRKDSVGTRVFDFEISPTGDGPTPSISLNSVATGNNSVRVEIRPEGLSGEAKLLCSVDSGVFTQCGPSQLLTAEVLGEKGVLLIVVAIGNRGLMAAGSLHVERPTTQPSGHVMIGIASVEAPDPFGRIRVVYNTSRNDVYCLCRVNTTSVDCQSKEYLADPRVLGAGTHVLSITCMDSSSYIDRRVIKFVLTLPPTPPPGPLSCDVAVTTEEQRLVVSYSCDRRVMATCQVSSLPVEPCNSLSGIYVVNLSALGAGPQIFILSVDDGFGKSLMKIIPFSVGTAHRKCCPVIERNASSLSVRNSQLKEAQLAVSVAPGNCSMTEGFSYSINWGDGASESGMLQTLSSVQSWRQYNADGSYVVEVNFCNSPSTEQDVCCDTISLELLVEPH